MKSLKKTKNQANSNAQKNNPYDARKWQTVTEMKKVAKVYDQVNNYMMPYRNSACWFDDSTQDMLTHFQNCEKQYVMTSTPQTTEEGFADVKPPTTWKSMEAVVAEFVDNHYRIRVKPQGGSYADQKAWIYEQTFENRANVNHHDIRDAYTFFTMALKGLAYQYIPWTTIINKGRFAKQAKSLSDKEKTLLENLGKVFYVTKKYKKFDDYDVVNVPPEEMFVSPEGSRFHGNTDVIGKKCWERWIGIDEFHYMFDNDPFAQNVDKVQPAGTEGCTYSPFFTEAEGNLYKKKVRLRLYEDPFADEIMFVVNDSLIKDMPFPDLFKGKSLFVDFHYVDLPGHHYTPGIAAILKGQQEELATIKNMIYDQLHIEINPPTYIDSLMAEEYMQERQYAKPGAIIPLTGLAQNPNAIQPHRSQGTGMAQAMGIIPMIESDITQTLGLDVRRFGVTQRAGSATEVSSNDTASLKILMKATKNFANSKAIVGELQYLWIKSKYADPMTDHNGEIIWSDDAKKEAKLRTITLDNVEITPAGDKNSLYKKVDKIGSFTLDLKPEYLDLEIDPFIFIDPEDIKKMSKPLQAQIMQNTMAQVANYAGLPGMPAPYGGPAVIDLNKMLKDYLKVQNQPVEWFIQTQDTYEDQIKEANKHVQKIVEDGVPLIGMVGAGKDHIQYEKECYVAIQSAVLAIKRQVDREIQNQQVQIDPMTGQPLPHKPSEAENKMMDLMDKLALLDIHLMSHGLPAGTPQPNISQLEGAVTGTATPPPVQQPADNGQPAQPGGAQNNQNAGSKAPVVPTPTPMMNNSGM